ncbi:NERD domain-containing protein [Streptomyces fuscigenes]|nr:NERD domain-containing protein [Streptomyces fuscigenes]
MVRLANALNIPTRAGALASRYEEGARGERRTARRLEPLHAEGWHIFHDLALPGRRENVDHLLISPAGGVFLPDTKSWSSRYPVTVRLGHLFHGDRDVTGRLTGLQNEAATVARLLGVPVTPLVVMDGAALHGPHGRRATELELYGLRIIPAPRLTAYLRARARIPGQRRPADLVAAVERVLPAYTVHHRNP